MSNFAVIGAAGFVGSHLCTALFGNGHGVLGYDHVPGLPLGGDVSHYMQIDLVQQTPEFPVGLAGVFYLAQSPFYREFPSRGDHLFAVNVLAALRCATAARDAGARFFFYASTGNVYAPSFLPHTEEGTTTRNAPYALSKLQAEEVLSLLSNDTFQVICGRLFGVFGPGQKSMLPVILKNKVLTGEPIILESASTDGADVGGLRVSFSYVYDLVNWLITLGDLATSGVRLPRILNLAGEEVVCIKKFGKTLARIFGKEVQFTIGPQPRTFDLVADLSRMKALFPPKFTNFEQAILQTYDMQ